MNGQTALSYDLGLDIGVASVGVSIVRVNDEDMAEELAAFAVRCFEAGVEGDVEQGRDSSRAVVRRTKRVVRRQLWRRLQPWRKSIADVAARAGLLPAGATKTPEECHALIITLDGDLSKKWATDPVTAHTWPYRIRAAALDARLEPFELGRCDLPDGATGVGIRAIARRIEKRRTRGL